MANWVVKLAAALAVVALLTPPSTEASVYKVGDSVGWTTIGNFDYRQWAATKTFHVGDIILFEYHPQFHNVMQVSHHAYRTCNASSPIATYTTGNDSITITKHGHHFFLCGVPGHCQSGQNVDINVPRVSSSIAPTPTVSSTPVLNPTTPGLSPSAAARLDKLETLLTKPALVLALLVLSCRGNFQSCIMLFGCLVIFV
ncbi:hypothetical protein Dimus_029338 [Dionaea muscipula]